ncbi:hypothetical protein VAT7223_02051 [Vibrio atlanticus]|uniref:Uncharacterized protein n=1 Tax=Vibrio atlanticus TaxID=693153 RepID=A0A1C3IRY8_9VIBR|nr:hypothetical protein VAT7223_02051 [Vibrio atlanticus]
MLMYGSSVAIYRKNTKDIKTNMGMFYWLV